jgi:hypothetical protein
MLCYPELLTLSVERDVQPALQALRALEMSEEQIRQLVYEYPLVLTRQQSAEVRRGSRHRRAGSRRWRSNRLRALHRCVRPGLARDRQQVAPARRRARV